MQHAAIPGPGTIPLEDVQRERFRWESDLYSKEGQNGGGETGSLLTHTRTMDTPQPSTRRWVEEFISQRYGNIRMVWMDGPDRDCVGHVNKDTLEEGFEGMIFTEGAYEIYRGTPGDMHACARGGTKDNLRMTYTNGEGQPGGNLRRKASKQP